MAIGEKQQSKWEGSAVILAHQCKVLRLEPKVVI